MIRIAKRASAVSVGADSSASVLGELGVSKTARTTWQLML